MGNFSKDFGHSSRCCHHVRSEWKIHFSYSFSSSSLSRFFSVHLSLLRIFQVIAILIIISFIFILLYILCWALFVCYFLSLYITQSDSMSEEKKEVESEKRILVLISLAISFQVSKVLCKLLFGYECDCRFVCLATCIPSNTVCHMLSGTVYF